MHLMIGSLACTTDCIGTSGSSRQVQANEQLSSLEIMHMIIADACPSSFSHSCMQGRRLQCGRQVQDLDHLRIETESSCSDTSLQMLHGLWLKSFWTLSKRHAGLAYCTAHLLQNVH